MFMLSNSNNELEYDNPSDHAYLQILDPEKNRVLMVKASMESFIVQVRESADVLSKGKLRATLHCVCRTKKMKNLSRETFVGFLQPAWSKTFHLSNHPMEWLT
ncbi:2-oxoglutarate (2OG) and Fe(II)-dependent oxygenase superfamily protein [Forsythia ovata]|uniref:2-oxoglutarate (2OG) and Fe(II)-dependent oxygenase superfamily protein n=1 Tax=Forsythia ovata TaxID=205694 RepID=A0ABD1WT92_9LAMI